MNAVTQLVTIRETTRQVAVPTQGTVSGSLGMWQVHEGRADPGSRDSWSAMTHTVMLRGKTPSNLRLVEITDHTLLSLPQKIYREKLKGRK